MKEKSLADRLLDIYGKNGNSNKIVYTRLGPGTLKTPTPKQIEDYISNQQLRDRANPRP